MPILPPETCLYPEDLLERPAVNPAIYPEEQIWWAVYCLAQHEKQLMRKLLVDKTSFYCPMIKKRFRSPSGRLQTSYLPLFKGYVFITGGEMQRYKAVSTGCVARCIVVDNVEQLLTDLRLIKQLIDCGKPLTLEERLQPGSPVRIRSGIFQGIEGTIIRRQNETRLMVAVNFLQQGASVLLEDCQIEAV